MSGTYFALNQKYNNLKTQAQISAGGGGGGGGSYINYPTAQGPVTLLNTTVQGTLTVNNVKNKITLTDASNNGSLIVGKSTTAPTCNAIDSIFIGDESGRYLANNVFACTAVGVDTLRNLNQTSTGNTEYYNTAIGQSTLTRVVNSDGNTLANTGCGYSTLASLLTGNNNSGFGSESGNISTVGRRLLNGSSNTFLGAKTGLNPALSGSCNHSTAVGADALITDSNQIQLGTGADYVNIPNYIKFSDNTTISSGYGNVGMVDIRKFGAVGDGIFNNTTAINSAIASCGTGNKTLYIPQGVFAITATLNFINLTNFSIFSEGSIIPITNPNFPLLYISNVDEFTINGSLTLNNPNSITGVTAVYIDETVGPVLNTRITNVMVKDIYQGFYIEGISSGLKILSNIQIFNFTYGILCKAENTVLSDFTIQTGNIGVFNYGHLSVSGGYIRSVNTGIVSTEDLTITPFHNYLDVTSTVFDGLDSCGIMVIASTNATITSNIFTSIGGAPLANVLIPVAYQSKFVNGIYLQDCANIVVSSNVFNLNVNSPIGINGVTDTIINSCILYNGNSNALITVLGTGETDSNYNVTISSNIYPDYTDAILSYDTSVVSDIRQRTVSFSISGNSTLKNYYTFSNTGVPTVGYIDNNYPFYNINSNCVDTIYLSPLINNKEFCINFTRTSSPPFHTATIPFISVRILPSQPAYGINYAPELCDGLRNNTITVGGTTFQVIEFYKEGNYRFVPNIGTGADTFSTGGFTVYQSQRDPHLYFNPVLNASQPLNLNSPLFFNTVIDITAVLGSVNQNVNLIDGGFGTTNIYTGSTLQLFNNSEFTLTLSRPAGSTSVFSGAYGNGASSITLPANTWYLITFDGTNYLINERSANPTYSNTGITSTPVTYTGNFNYTNATLRLASTIATTVNWMLPTDIKCHHTTTRIYNVGTTILTLSLSATNFIGKYGSGTTSLIIPANNFIDIFSNGANWLVQDRSNPTFNFNLPSSGTLLDWTSNSQYLDGKVEFVQPDNSAITSPTTFTGTATQSGYILSIVSITGTITAGSVLTLNRRMIIRSQISGTLGGVGTYLVTYSQTVGSATAFSNGYSGTGTNSSGLISISAGQTTNFSVATVSGIVNVGTIIGTATNINVSCVPFYILSGTGGGNCNISSAALANVSAQTYYATSGNTVYLPLASSVSGRSATIINSSNNPVNITTSAGTSLFNGLYGQILDTGIFPNNYFLRPNETVVLKSDGTNWETQTGTTLNGARSFVFVSGPASNGVDRVLTQITSWTTLDSTNSSLTGFINSSGTFLNAYPFVITVNIAVVLAWNNPSAAATTTSPQRIGTIVPNASGTASNTTSIVSYQNYPFVITQATGVMTPTAFQMSQTFNGIFTLRPYESITISFGKVNGSSTTESCGSGTVYINRIA